MTLSNQADVTAVVERSDPRYETLKRGHNLRFPATSAEAASRIVICSSEDETASALQRIVTSGLRPTVRSGGHCYEDFVSNNPGGAILDLSTYKDVNRLQGAYRVAPGALLGEVYQTLYKRYGVTLPAGTCYMVGAGGHISGGGYGLLSRMHGLTSDWLTAIDILTVDVHGSVISRRVDSQRDPDLFRACRGAGGGNFGVITGFHFAQLPPAPQEVAEASLYFSWSTMTEERLSKILTTYGDYWATRGRESDTWGLFTIMFLVPDNHNGARCGIHTQFVQRDGTAKDVSIHREFLDRFTGLNPEQVAHPSPGDHSPTYQIERRPWLEATLAGGGSGGGSRAKYKSAYMKKNFTPAECSAIYKHLCNAGSHSQGVFLSIDSYGGAINSPERMRDTAIAQRASIMKLQWQCYWHSEEEDSARLKYTDDFFTAVYTGSHVSSEFQGTPLSDRFEGCYMNYADSDMLRYKHWPQLFYGTGPLYPFLQSVKRRYDPNNIFHNSMSVRA